MKGLSSLGGSKVSVLAPSSGRNTHRPLPDSASRGLSVSPARVSDKEVSGPESQLVKLRDLIHTVHYRYLMSIGYQRQALNSLSSEQGKWT